MTEDKDSQELMERGQECDEFIPVVVRPAGTWSVGKGGTDDIARSKSCNLDAVFSLFEFDRPNQTGRRKKEIKRMVRQLWSRGPGS